jgi:hypothetical protein
VNSSSKRTTIYFDPDLHQALRLKAIVSSQSISEIVNNAVRKALAEDTEDLTAFDLRAKENRLDFEQLVGSLRKRGKA